MSDSNYNFYFGFLDFKTMKCNKSFLKTNMKEKVLPLNVVLLTVQNLIGEKLQHTFWVFVSNFSIFYRFSECRHQRNF